MIRHSGTATATVTVWHQIKFTTTTRYHFHVGIACACVSVWQIFFDHLYFSELIFWLLAACHRSIRNRTFSFEAQQRHSICLAENRSRRYSYWRKIHFSLLSLFRFINFRVTFPYFFFVRSFLIHACLSPHSCTHTDMHTYAHTWKVFQYVWSTWRYL